MKALKCKPSAQFAYSYTINVLSKCGNIISHRPSILEGLQCHIDRRSSKVDTSIFEGRHIDLRRSKAETSHRQPNIAPTFRKFVTEYCPQRRFIVIPKIRVVRITLDEGTHAHTRQILVYSNIPTRALVMYYTPIYIAYMR